jgi:hypothetical protein
LGSACSGVLEIYKGAYKPAIWHAPGCIYAHARCMVKVRAMFCYMFVWGAQNELLVDTFEMKVSEHVRSEDHDMYTRYFRAVVMTRKPSTLPRDKCMKACLPWPAQWIECGTKLSRNLLLTIMRRGCRAQPSD